MEKKSCPYFIQGIFVAENCAIIARFFGFAAFLLGQVQHPGLFLSFGGFLHDRKVFGRGLLSFFLCFLRSVVFL